MQKRTFLTFFVFCSLFLIQNTFGQNETNMSIHGSLGLSRVSEKNIGSGFWSGFGFSIPIDRDVHLSFNFGAWKSQVSSQADGLQDGSLKVNPFFISLYYFPELGNPLISPYIFVGGGYIFSSFKIENILTIPEITFSQKIDNSPGGRVGAGIKIEISKLISLTSDVSYFYSRASGTTTIEDLNFGTILDEFSLNLSAIIFQLGIKFLI